MNSKKRNLTLLLASIALVVGYFALHSGRDYFVSLEEKEFEEKLKQIKVGATPNEITEHLELSSPKFIYSSSSTILPLGNTYCSSGFAPIYYGRHWYCIYTQLERPPAPSPSMGTFKSNVVQVFKIPRAPRNFVPVTEHGKAAQKHENNEAWPFNEDFGYIFEFIEFVSRREWEGVDIPFELTHEAIADKTFDQELIDRALKELNKPRTRSSIRLEIVQKLSRVRLNHRDVMSELKKFLKDENPEIRKAAEESLRALEVK